MGEAQEGMKRAFGRGWTRILLAVVAILVVYAGLSLVFSLWPFSSIAGVVGKVTSAESIIGNYEWFYDQKAAIDSTRMKYKVAKEAGMEEAPGILMVLEGMIAEYNARSRMTTRSLWKAADLPYQIDSEVGE